jgi:hypothetical protein
LKPCWRATPPRSTASCKSCWRPARPSAVCATRRAAACRAP